MFECSHLWQGTTRDGIPLDVWCRCLRQFKHDGAHRCACEPVSFFTMQYASEDQR